VSDHLRATCVYYARAPFTTAVLALVARDGPRRGTVRTTPKSEPHAGTSRTCGVTGHSPIHLFRGFNSLRNITPLLTICCGHREALRHLKPLCPIWESQGFSVPVNVLFLQWNRPVIRLYRFRPYNKQQSRLCPVHEFHTTPRSHYVISGRVQKDLGVPVDM